VRIRSADSIASWWRPSIVVVDQPNAAIFSAIEPIGTAPLRLSK
jgi:hypothetical protein